MANTPQQLIDSAQVELSPRQLESLKFDLASDIQTADTIGKRYGFNDRAGLVKFLAANPWIVNEVRQLKTLLESDQATPDRIKIKSQFGYEEVIPAIAGIALDETKPARDRIDAAKLLSNTGGVNAGPKAEGGATGTQFSLTINFPDRVEKITTVVDGQATLEPPADA